MISYRFVPISSQKGIPYLNHFPSPGIIIKIMPCDQKSSTDIQE